MRRSGTLRLDVHAARPRDEVPLLPARRHAGDRLARLRRGRRRSAGGAAAWRARSASPPTSGSSWRCRA
ncbi:MAG: hypothetical protein MZW92_77455 [Comamonadaceae bacterium]|nr:hypothetical protein [Comamonadaceae bacterium]